MSTADAARAVISAAESAPTETPSAPASSNAAEYPQLAVEEMDHLIGDDQTNATKRIAAAMTVLHDPRPFMSTAQGMARRQFWDDGDFTRRAAREAVDLAAWAEGEEANPGDKQALALHGFAADVNRGAMDSVLPAGGDVLEPGSDEWHEAANSIIDRIIASGGQR